MPSARSHKSSCARQSGVQQGLRVSRPSLGTCRAFAASPGSWPGAAFGRHPGVFLPSRVPRWTGSHGQETCSQLGRLHPAALPPQRVWVQRDSPAVSAQEIPTALWWGGRVVAPLPSCLPSSIGARDSFRACLSVSLPAFCRGSPLPPAFILVQCPGSSRCRSQLQFYCWHLPGLPLLAARPSSLPAPAGNCEGSDLQSPNSNCLNPPDVSQLPFTAGI